MEFLGAIVNVVFLLAIFLFAHDWLVGLRSDVSTTRIDLKATTKELLEARMEMIQFNAEAAKQSAEQVDAVADLLRELRELRAEFKVLAHHNLAVGEVKVLVEGRQEDLARALSHGSTPDDETDET
jgi:hypothetical protein